MSKTTRQPEKPAASVYFEGMSFAGDGTGLFFTPFTMDDWPPRSTTTDESIREDDSEEQIR